MRLAFRATALAFIAGLTATLLLLRPGSEPVAAAAQPTVDADLALVPTDAVGFIHVRAADLWKNDLFAGFRQIYEKAGPKALAALDCAVRPEDLHVRSRNGVPHARRQQTPVAVRRAALRSRRSIRRTL